MIKYSVILPAFNEQECLPSTLKRICDSLSPCGDHYEIICVDDGSHDDTWNTIQTFNQKNPSVKGLHFQRNFGHQIAIYAGICYASGEYIVIIDADGQDPPEIIPEMFKKCEDGYDIVHAVRKKRKENILKKTAYHIFYRIYEKLVPFKVPLDSGDFAVFNRKVCNFLKSLPEKRPFIRGLRSWYGGRQTSITYERQARVAGKPKYTYWKLFHLALHGSISFSRLPMRWIGLLGFIFSILSLLLGFFLLITKITIGIEVQGWTSTAILITFFGGINLLVLSIMGEYIGDIFDEVKNRPRFLIGDTAGIKINEEIN